MKSALIVLMGAVLAALGFVFGWTMKGDLIDVQSSNVPAVIYVERGGGSCGCCSVPPIVQVVVTVEACSVVPELSATPIPTSTSTAIGPTNTRTVRPTETDEPRDTKVPPTVTEPVLTATSTEQPTLEPTGTQEPEDTPEPTRTPKPHCNKGEGNGEEDCDPGNNPDNGNDDEN